MKKNVCITISDGEPDKELGKIGDDWSMDLWDELVKNKPEQWDIRDALKHGKNQGQGYQSSRKAQSQHEERPSEAKCKTMEPEAVSRG